MTKSMIVLLFFLLTIINLSFAGGAAYLLWTLPHQHNLQPLFVPAVTDSNQTVVTPEPLSKALAPDEMKSYLVQRYLIERYTFIPNPEEMQRREGAFQAQATQNPAALSMVKLLSTVAVFKAWMEGLSKHSATVIDLPSIKNIQISKALDVAPDGSIDAVEALIDIRHYDLDSQDLTGVETKTVKLQIVYGGLQDKYLKKFASGKLDPLLLFQFVVIYFTEVQ